jgi:hypothetical protein
MGPVLAMCLESGYHTEHSRGCVTISVYRALFSDAWLARLSLLFLQHILTIYYTLR